MSAVWLEITYFGSNFYVFGANKGQN